MAKKEFSKFFIASMKRTAQNVYPLVRRKTKLLEEMADMNAELQSIEAQIAGYQIPIKEATGGYTTEDLIVRKVTDTGKTDKDGRPIKQTTYELKYPETVIPEETVNCVQMEDVENCPSEVRDALEDTLEGINATMNL